MQHCPLLRTGVARPGSGKTAALWRKQLTTSQSKLARLEITRVGTCLGRAQLSSFSSLAVQKFQCSSITYGVCNFARPTSRCFMGLRDSLGQPKSTGILRFRVTQSSSRLMPWSEAGVVASAGFSSRACGLPRRGRVSCNGTGATGDLALMRGPEIPCWARSRRASVCRRLRG